MKKDVFFCFSEEYFIKNYFLLLKRARFKFSGSRFKPNAFRRSEILPTCITIPATGSAGKKNTELKNLETPTLINFGMKFDFKIDLVLNRPLKGKFSASTPERRVHGLSAPVGIGIGIGTKWAKSEFSAKFATAAKSPELASKSTACSLLPPAGPPPHSCSCHTGILVCFQNHPCSLL